MLYNAIGLMLTTFAMMLLARYNSRLPVRRAALVLAILSGSLWLYVTGTILVRAAMRA